MLESRKPPKFETPKDGEPVYLVFRYGRLLLDGQSKPRVFYSEEHFKEHKKRWNGTFLPTDKLVKYVPETVKE